jgi:predicted nucleic acid-binding protein
VTTAGSVVVLDTNVLLEATVPGRSLHRQARIVLDDWPNQGVTLAASGQVLREYLVVCTRPPASNGLGLAIADALTNVARLRARLLLLAENERSLDRLIEILTTTGSAGKQAHDANVVATSVAAGARSLVTADVAHFRRFGQWVDVIDLGSVA